LLLGTGFVWGLWADGWSSAGTISNHSSAISALAVPEAAAAIRQVTPTTTQELHSGPLKGNLDRVVDTAPAEANRPATLKNLYLVQVGEQLRVEAVFSHVPQYRLIRRAQGRALVLELPTRTKVVSLPTSESPPLLEKMAFQPCDDRGHLVFSFKKACRFDELQLIDKPDGDGQTLIFVVRSEPPEVRPAVLPKSSPPVAPSTESAYDREDIEPPPAPEASPPTRALVRQPTRPSTRQRAERVCRDGIDALQKGRFTKAEQAFRIALAIDPSHIGARDALLNHLHQQNRHDEFDALLAEGVRQAPSHQPYRARFVRRLIEQGDLTRAREALTREPLPPADQLPELHAMLATVNLRQGHYREAAATYRTLLTIDPGQAVWWMGLGIALEGDAAWDQARHAYGQALANGELSNGLRTFIRQRLAASRNAATGESSAGKIYSENRS
jgi:MSHA biogenesis protein MshN